MKLLTQNEVDALPDGTNIIIRWYATYAWIDCVKKTLRIDEDDINGAVAISNGGWLLGSLDHVGDGPNDDHVALKIHSE